MNRLAKRMLSLAMAVVVGTSGFIGDAASAKAAEVGDEVVTQGILDDLLGGVIDPGDIEDIVGDIPSQDEIDEWLGNIVPSGSAIISSGPAMYIGDGAYKSGDFYYKINKSINSNDEKTVTLVGTDKLFTTTDKPLTIPSKVDITVNGETNEYKVISISGMDNAAMIPINGFAWQIFITQVDIPPSIKYIDKSAFEGCIRLESVLRGDHVERIGIAAFKGCTSLKTVDMLTTPKYKKLGKEAFKDTPALPSKVWISAELEEVSGGASLEGPFSGNCGVKDFILPSSSAYIPNDLFNGCTNLTSITIPDSVLENKNPTMEEKRGIGERAFKNCSNLEQEFLFKDKEIKIGSEAFAGCSKATIVCYEDSTAHKAAKKDRVNYRLLAGTLEFVSDGKAIESVEVDAGTTVDLDNESDESAGPVVKLAIKPENYDKNNLEWTSSDTTVATVSGSSITSTGKAGEATITVKAKDEGESSTSIKVVVNKFPSTLTLKASASSEGAGEKADTTYDEFKRLTYGRTVKMNITGVVKKNAPGVLAGEREMDPAAFTFTSSDEKLATVDGAGIITGQYKGEKTATATITATMKDDPLDPKNPRKVSLNVVVANTQIASIKLNPAGTSVNEANYNSSTDTLRYQIDKNAASTTIYVTPEAKDQGGNVMDVKNFTWASSNTKLCTVKTMTDGSGKAMVVLNLKNGGSASITATAKDLNKAVGRLNIYVSDGKPVLLAKSATLNCYKTVGPRVEILPSYGNEIISGSSIVIKQKNKGYESTITDITAKVVDESGRSYVQFGYVEASPGQMLANGSRKNLSLEVPTTEGVKTIDGFALKIANAQPKISAKCLSKFPINYKDGESTIQLKINGGNEIAHVVGMESNSFNVSPATGDCIKLRYMNPSDSAKSFNKPSNKLSLRVFVEGYRDAVVYTTKVSFDNSKPTVTPSRKNSIFSKYGDDSATLTYKIKEKRADGLVNEYEPEIYTIKGVDFTKGKSQTIEIPVQKGNWVAPIVLKHTVKQIETAPKITLGKKTAIVNKDFLTGDSIPIKINCDNVRGQYTYEVTCTEKDVDAATGAAVNAKNFVVAVGETGETIKCDIVDHPNFSVGAPSVYHYELTATPKTGSKLSSEAKVAATKIGFTVNLQNRLTDKGDYRVKPTLKKTKLQLNIQAPKAVASTEVNIPKGYGVVEIAPSPGLLFKDADKALAVTGDAETKTVEAKFKLGDLISLGENNEDINGQIDKLRKVLKEMKLSSVSVPYQVATKLTSDKCTKEPKGEADVYTQKMTITVVDKPISLAAKQVGKFDIAKGTGATIQVTNAVNMPHTKEQLAEGSYIIEEYELVNPKGKTEADKYKKIESSVDKHLEISGVSVLASKGVVKGANVSVNAIKVSDMRLKQKYYYKLVGTINKTTVSTKMMSFTPVQTKYTFSASGDTTIYRNVEGFEGKIVLTTKNIKSIPGGSTSTDGEQEEVVKMLKKVSLASNANPDLKAALQFDFANAIYDGNTVTISYKVLNPAALKADGTYTLSLLVEPRLQAENGPETIAKVKIKTKY